MQSIEMKNTNLAFGVDIEIVIWVASNIRRAGLFAFAALCENIPDFADAEAKGALQKYNDLS